MEFAKCTRCGRHNIIWDMERDATGNLVCVVGCVIPFPTLVPPLPNKLPPQTLAEEFGFTHPEDGSEDRYVARKLKVGPVRHAFFWWLHNTVAHPLIGVFPFRFAFKFHDWTSRKLHGR
jgi:hypothetical protein